MRAYCLLLALVILSPSFAKAENYGGCSAVFAKLKNEGAAISPIQDVVVDREQRSITYILPDRQEYASFPPGPAELLAVKEELYFLGRSWYVVLRVPGGRTQPHYARDVGDGCEHYPISPPRSAS